MKPLTVRFLDCDCVVEFGRYPNGRTALQLNTPDGEPFTTATVNMPGVPLGERQVLIKDYSENEGVLAALSNAGIVRDTGAEASAGFSRVAVCDLLVDPPWKQPSQESVLKRFANGARPQARSTDRDIERDR